MAISPALPPLPADVVRRVAPTKLSAGQNAKIALAQSLQAHRQCENQKLRFKTFYQQLRQNLQKSDPIS